MPGSKISEGDGLEGSVVPRSGPVETVIPRSLHGLRHVANPPLALPFPREAF